MVVKITSKRQVTFPAAVLKSLGVGPGDRLEIIEGPHGFTVKPKRIDYSKLGTLRGKLDSRIAPFDINQFRDQPHERSLRD